MKTRQGFVSNSSTSSFCIYGASVSLDENNEDICERHRLEYHETEYSTYIGRSWKTIGDEETGAQFKKSVEDALKTFDKNIKCRTIEEAWYDG